MHICLRFSLASSSPCMEVMVLLEMEPIYLTVRYFSVSGDLLTISAMILIICRPKGQLDTTNASRSGSSDLVTLAQTCSGVNLGLAGAAWADAVAVDCTTLTLLMSSVGSICLSIATKLDFCW